MSAPLRDVSVIIVNWNSADDLRRCLASLYAHTNGISFEVIVVDNASYDGSDAMLRAQFPQVRYLQSQENRGFAGANNWGVKHSSGRLLLFLNPDTQILGDAIPTMAKGFASINDAGAVGCRILNADGTLQTSCVQAFPTLLNEMLDSDLLRRLFPDSPLWGTAALWRPGSDPRRVEMISGACLMVRRDLFEQVAGFPSCYFMYGEDVELCYRVVQAGWGPYYLPAAEIIHYGAGSSSKHEESMFSVRESQKSIRMFFANTRGPLTAYAFQVLRFLTAVVRLTLITCSFPVATSPEKRLRRKSSLRKWAAILRWSLGRNDQPKPSGANSDGVPASGQSQKSSPRTDLV